MKSDSAAIVTASLTHFNGHVAAVTGAHSTKLKHVQLLAEMTHALTAN
jgi:hypothetical protein